MKKDKGTTLLVVGMMLSSLGMTVLTENKIIQYSALIIGLLMSIYSVFVTEKWKKSQKKTKK
jgi:hypothetical protein